MTLIEDDEFWIKLTAKLGNGIEGDIAIDDIWSSTVKCSLIHDKVRVGSSVYTVLYTILYITALTRLVLLF